jgi:hypothetical protein
MIQSLLALNGHSQQTTESLSARSLACSRQDLCEIPVQGRVDLDVNSLHVSVLRTGTAMRLTERLCNTAVTGPAFGRC